MAKWLKSVGVVVALVAATIGAIQPVGAVPTEVHLTDLQAPDGILQGVAARAVSLSDDGRLLLWEQNPAFPTLATPMITDLETGVITQLAAAGTGSPVDLSSNGRYVLFVKFFFDGGPQSSISVLDRNLGTTVVIATSSDFSGTAVLNWPEFTGGGPGVSFIRSDGGTATIERRTRAGGSVFSRSFVSDFDEVNFAENGAQVVWGRRNGPNYEVFLRSLPSGTDVLIHTAVGANGRETPVEISPDGRFVVAGGVLIDRVAGTSTTFVGSVELGLGTGGPQGPLALAADGSVVAFSTSEALDSNDTNGVTDIYTWHPADGSYRRVSETDRGTQLDGASVAVVITDDGSKAVFGTGAGNASSVNSPLGTNAHLLLEVELGNPPTDNGYVDAIAQPGGGVLLVNVAGEVMVLNGATRFDDCNMEFSSGGTNGRPGLNASETVTSISSTPAGDGYWLFTNTGRVIDCGAAEHFGDLSAIQLAGDIVDTVATTSGKGYYMVGADGGLFAFGDAAFLGSVPEVLPGIPLAGEIVAITVTETGLGYRMVASDGGMFNFGDAAFFGSIPQVLPGVTLAGPMTGMVASSTGYLIVGSDGGIFNFGESVFHGSLGGQSIPAPIRSVVVVSDLSGYVMFDGDARSYPFGSGGSLLG